MVGTGGEWEARGLLTGILGGFRSPRKPPRDPEHPPSGAQGPPPGLWLGSGWGVNVSRDISCRPVATVQFRLAPEVFMSFRTNPDRILDSIDRARTREDDGGGFVREATFRELDTEVPPPDSTSTERLRRIFALVERAYTATASSTDMRRLAQRFQAVGDISNHHARGDVSVAIHWMDHEREDDVGVSPFEILPKRLEEAKKENRSSRPDANALKILRTELRNGVLGAYGKIEPRIREAIRSRADLGHVAVRVTVDLRPGS